MSGRMRLLAGVAILALAVAAPVVWWVTRVDVTCGIVISIDQASLTDVRTFVLRSPDGAETRFLVDPARLSPGSFTPGHLREHLTTVSPVCVSTRPGESPPVAVDLRDGPIPSLAPATDQSPTGTPRTLKPPST